MKTTVLKRLFSSLFKREILQIPSKSSCVSIKLFLPERDRNGNPIPSKLLEDWKNYFSITISQIFGGCFIESVTSHYLNQHQQIIKEQTSIINASYFDNDFKVQIMENLISSLTQFGAETMQETVLYQFNQKSYLITI